MRVGGPGSPPSRYFPPLRSKALSPLGRGLLCPCAVRLLAAGQAYGGSWSLGGLLPIKLQLVWRCGVVPQSAPALWRDGGVWVWGWRAPGSVMGAFEVLASCLVLVPPRALTFTGGTLQRGCPDYRRRFSMGIFLSTSLRCSLCVLGSAGPPVSLWPPSGGVLGANAYLRGLPLGVAASRCAWTF